MVQKARRQCFLEGSRAALAGFTLPLVLLKQENLTQVRSLHKVEQAAALDFHTFVPGQERKERGVVARRAEAGTRG